MACAISAARCFFSCAGRLTECAETRLAGSTISSLPWAGSASGAASPCATHFPVASKDDQASALQPESAGRSTRNSVTGGGLGFLVIVRRPA